MRTPLQGLLIPLKKSGIHIGKTTASSSSLLASAKSAMSSQCTLGSFWTMSRSSISASSWSGPGHSNFSFSSGLISLVSSTLSSFFGGSSSFFFPFLTVSTTLPFLGMLAAMSPLPFLLAGVLKLLPLTLSPDVEPPPLPLPTPTLSLPLLCLCSTTLGGRGEGWLQV